MLSAPPKSVPVGLSYAEYQRLYFRYALLKWPTQTAAALHHMMRLAPPVGNLNEESKQKVAALIKVMEVGLLVNEEINELQDAAMTLATAALDKTDKFLDKFSGIAKAKDGIKGAVSLLGQLAHDGAGKVVEDLVLPGIGMPIEKLPEGCTPRRYLLLARQYERFGWAESARAALDKVVEMAPSSEEAGKAKKLLKCRIPKTKIPREAMRKHMEAMKDALVNRNAPAKAIFEELVREYPDFDWPYVNLSGILIAEGEVERANTLLLRVLKQNPDYLNGWCARANLAIVTWQMKDLDDSLEKARSLDPADQQVVYLGTMQDLFRRAGIV